MSGPAAEAARAGGVIYDIGYRHYDGPRRGRLAVIAALYAQGLRTLFGIGRGERAKLVPWSLFAIALLPAIIDAAVASLSGNQARIVPHDRFFQVGGIIIALFCAGQAPELMASDRTHRVLTLYFSRPLRRFDYVVARWGSLVSALMVMLLAPQLILFFARVMVMEAPWAAFRADAPLLPPILLSGVLIAVLLGGLSVLCASLVSRRVYASAAILGLLLVSQAGGAALVQLSPDRFRYGVLVSPMFVSEGLTAWLFDRPPRRRSPVGRADLDAPVYGTAAITISAASLLLVIARYRRIDA